MSSSWGRSSSPRLPCVSGTRPRSRGCGRSSSTPISALDPRAFDPALPVRIVDIDEESLKQVGQWPWPRTVLAELVDKLAAGGAAAIGFDMVFPEPDRMSPANTLRFWPKSDALAGLSGGGREASHQRPGLRRGDRQGPVVLGFIASPQGTSLPETKAGFAHGGDDPKLFAPYYPGAAASLTELQDKAQGAGSLNWIPEHDQIIRRMPMLVQRRRHALSLFVGRHAQARARRFDLCGEVLRRERREGVRREDRHRRP